MCNMGHALHKILSQFLLKEVDMFIYIYYLLLNGCFNTKPDMENKHLMLIFFEQNEC